MNPQEISEYVNNSFSQGKKQEDIYKELLEKGCSIDQIQQGFSSIKSKEHKDDVQKKAIYCIVVFGAILIGAGIFSFVASNWRHMSKIDKVSIILIGMLASYVSSWVVSEKLNLKKTGGALTLLGCIIYGSGIFLVGQIFNIRANWPDGFILWMFGVLALAYALDSVLLYGLAMPIGAVAIFGYPIAIFESFFGHNPFLLTSTLLLLVSAIITFVTGWIMGKKVPLELKEDT